MKTRIPPPVLMLLAALLMVWLHRSFPIAHVMTGELRWLGAFVAAFAIGINLAAFRRFRRANTTVNPLRPESASTLVTEGVFAYSRNPMYLGTLLLLVGLALGLGSLTPWLVPPTFAMLLTWLQIVPEERALAQIFGTRYSDYRRTTDRWLGRFGKPL